MTILRVLQFVLLALVLVWLVLWFQMRKNHERVLGWISTPTILTPVVVKKLPQTPLPAKKYAIFPPSVDRNYEVTPRVWDRRPVEMELAQGQVDVPAPMAWPLRDKQIAPAPAAVTFHWVFSLP